MKLHVPSLYEFLSSVERKRRYFESFIAIQLCDSFLWPPCDVSLIHVLLSFSNFIICFFIFMYAFFVVVVVGFYYFISVLVLLILILQPKLIFILLKCIFSLVFLI